MTGSLHSSWPAPLRDARDRRLQAVAITVGGVGLSSLAAFGAQPALGELGGALALVLGVTLVGALAGLIAGLAAAFAAFLLYDFLLAAPVLSFRLANDRDLTPLVIFNLCAIVAGLLAGRLKDRALAADRSNRQLLALLETSRALQAAIDPEEIAADVSAAHGDIHVVLASGKQGMAEIAGVETLPPGWGEAAIAALAAPAPMTSSPGLVCHKLEGGGATLGLLMAARTEQAQPDSSFLAALANLVTIALERSRLARRVAEREAAARTEALKTALLGSISHDFRTPLTAISASASSLVDYGDRLDDATSQRLLRGIVEECDRLDRYTANLLELSRLETAPDVGDLQPLDAAEMLAVAVQRVRPRAGARRITLAAEPGLIVRADAALFELVLINVLENAVRYSPEPSRIAVALGRDEGDCRITVADEGIGIPEDDLTRIFERFYRVPRADGGPRGTGLGLAIARGFVQALGGGIAASTPGLGGCGSLVTIRLPISSERGGA